MTLLFIQNFPEGQGSLSGKPTNFIEKIVKSLGKTSVSEKAVEIAYHNTNLTKGNTLTDFHTIINIQYDKIMSFPKKKHTIREDKSNKWTVGRDIHFATGNKISERKQFAPIVKVKGIQSIEIFIKDNEPKSLNSDKKHYQKLIIRDIEFYRCFMVKIGNKFINNETMKQLAINDGFNSVNDFFEYFQGHYKGKIIHWTCLKY